MGIIRAVFTILGLVGFYHKIRNKNSRYNLKGENIYMKKFIALLLIILFIPALSFAYETDSYKANLSNYTQGAEHTFSDNDNIDSGITITATEYVENIEEQALSYEDVYNESFLNYLKDGITQQLQTLLESISSTAINCTNACIDKFSDYDSLYFEYKIEVVENTFYYMWIYEIFSDNYVYCIMIGSSNCNYINSANLKTFIDSFKIKDTTNLCTQTLEATTMPVTNANITDTPNNVTTEYQTTNYTPKGIIFDIIFTAIIYLFLPVLIKLACKDGFKPMTAFKINLLNFLIIKWFLAVLLKTEFNTSSAWLYLFIGQAILTNHKPTNKEITEENEEKNEEENDIPTENDEK